MGDIYPLITENQTLGFNEIIGYVNLVSGGIYFPLLLLALWVIFFVVMMTFGLGRAFVYSSFFCSVLAIFMVVGGLLNPVYMYLLFIMLGVGLMILRLSKSSSLPQI